MSESCEQKANGNQYGLTCGFWTDDPDQIDAHVMKYHRQGEEVYDLDGPRG